MSWTWWKNDVTVHPTFLLMNLLQARAAFLKLPTIHPLLHQHTYSSALKSTIMASSASHTKAEDSPLPGDLLPLAHALLQAAKSAPLSTIQALLDKGAPAWYQDNELGWSSLHYAAERRDPELLSALLAGGAVWNAVDKWGRTAGEICLSLGDQEGWEVIRNEGVRSGRCSDSPLKC